MKNLVILMGTILLGLAIFQMMAGDDPDSLKSTASAVMRHSIQLYESAGEGSAG